MTWIAGPDPTGVDAGQSEPEPADRPEPSGPPSSYPSYPPPPPPPPARHENRGLLQGKSGPAAAWAKFRALRPWQQGLIVFGLLATLGTILPDQSPEEPATTAPTIAQTTADGPGSRKEPSTPTAAPVTDDEVVAVFQSFVDERVAAGVRLARTVRSITISNRVVRVVFDPAKAGIDLATFKSINPFDNLAGFAGTPIMFKDDLGKRLRPAIDAVETVLPDGTSLGSLTTAKLYKMGTGDDL